VDPQNAKKAAEEFIKREKRLDVLSLYMVSWCYYDFSAEWLAVENAAMYAASHNDVVDVDITP
jgi:hypothetical protein